MGNLPGKSRGGKGGGKLPALEGRYYGLDNVSSPPASWERRREKGRGEKRPCSGGGGRSLAHTLLSTYWHALCVGDALPSGTKGEARHLLEMDNHHTNLSFFLPRQIRHHRPAAIHGVLWPRETMCRSSGGELSSATSCWSKQTSKKIPC